MIRLIFCLFLATFYLSCQKVEQAKSSISAPTEMSTVTKEIQRRKNTTKINSNVHSEAVKNARFIARKLAVDAYLYRRMKVDKSLLKSSGWRPDSQVELLSPDVAYKALVDASLHLFGVQRTLNMLNGYNKRKMLGFKTKSFYIFVHESSDSVDMLFGKWLIYHRVLKKVYFDSFAVSTGFVLDKNGVAISLDGPCPGGFDYIKFGNYVKNGELLVEYYNECKSYLNASEGLLRLTDRIVLVPGSQFTEGILYTNSPRTQWYHDTNKPNPFGNGKWGSDGGRIWTRNRRLALSTHRYNIDYIYPSEKCSKTQAGRKKCAKSPVYSSLWRETCRYDFIRKKVVCGPKKMIRKSSPMPLLDVYEEESQCKNINICVAYLKKKLDELKAYSRLGFTVQPKSIKKIKSIIKTK